PHVILLGGDFVTWHRHIPLLANFIANFRARDGIFAVLGNHDYWAGADDVIAAMNAYGVRFLTNTSVALPLPVVGVAEIYRGNPDVDRAFANVDPNGPCIGISHHPDVIDLLDGRRIDLLLCGHTHGGQIRCPFFGAVVVPSRHEADYAAGFHRAGNVLMYVSRGIGSIPPIRILCRPEIATFVLRSGHRTP
ncbi:MAG TPA: metallophosphoesterase, partial [Thermoanaerobaculia bacterium]